MKPDCLSLPPSTCFHELLAATSRPQPLVAWLLPIGPDSNRRIERKVDPKEKRKKYYNCGKKRHFARECRSSKINNAKSDYPKKERERKTQKDFQ